VIVVMEKESAMKQVEVTYSPVLNAMVQGCFILEKIFCIYCISFIVRSSWFYVYQSFG